MKKSTLITTIAMIVVVVVALSTATYAWFSQATTTSTYDTITTTAASEWIIMGGKGSRSTGTEAVAYSSSTAISLEMLDGLYSPNAKITGTLDSSSISANMTLTEFFKAYQEGTGLATTAQAEEPSYDPIGGEGNESACNYVRVINTKSQAQNLVLTVTVLVADATNDANFYAANAFSTYVTWKQGTAAAGSANTAYYYGTVNTAGGTTGTGEGYYPATLADADTTNDDPNKVYDFVAASGVNYNTFNIDKNNEGMRSGSAADPKTGYTNAASIKDNPETALVIGGEKIESGYFYQFKINIATALAQNAAVNVAFYAWFDGWALDNTGANSGATVYYEFGAV